MPPPRALRRLLAPVLIAVEVALLALFALGALVGALTPRPRRLLRVCALACGYLCVELALWPLVVGTWLRRGGREADRRLLSWALRTVLAMARRCVGFRVELVGPPGPLDEPGPVLALARHGGPGDSFALAQLLLAHDRDLHIVLKDVLALDPALDILLGRLGSCFLPSPAGATDDLPGRLAELARDLDGRDTLLLFPEGGNWTSTRRTRAIRRLRRDHHDAAARAASSMPHVLPPRPGGVLAVLDARPDLPVAVLAHAGLDRLTSAGQVWRALPFPTPMAVKVWPAAAVPVDPDGRAAWLTTEWATVDEWVDAWHAGAVGDSPA